MIRFLIIIWFCIAPAASLAQAIPGFTPTHSEKQNELEGQYLTHPFSGNNERYLLKLTEEPHIAGSAESKRVAEYIQARYREWGLDAKLVEYRAYLPYPKLVHLSLIEPVQVGVDFKETAYKMDKDAFDERVVFPFNAYSPSGEVTAQVVYANRGLPEDYEVLNELGVDVRGKIAMVRYGGSFRGVKARVAEEQGAAGLIIYSDPADDGYMRGDIYPDGPMRPWKALQRGSLMYIFKYPGDPLSPGFASTPQAKLLKEDRAGNIPHVPTLPISYGDAAHILQNLAGPEAASGWQGGLPFRYHVGPGPAKVHMKLEMDYQVRPIYNVVVTIPGSGEPEHKVVVGNHHDAWTYGAVDPNSGTSVVMEMGRSLGELLKTGWRPRRTIILAHWDAEEYGLIGSTEWVEQFYPDLRKNAMLYLNIDSGVSGDRFRASAVPSLDAFIQEVVKQVPDPNSQLNVFQRWWERQNPGAFKHLNKQVPDTATVRIGRLGSGSDYTAFLDHAGIPSMDVRFTGRYGVYHSILDNFYWMSHWGDPGFRYHETLSKIAGIMVLRFADADVLPFNYADYAEAISRHIGDLEKHWQKEYIQPPFELTSLKEKVNGWKTLATQLQERLKGSLASETVPSQLNSYLMQIERDFTFDMGLPGREWFKHRIYAPGFYTGYASKPLPGIAEPAEKKNWKEAEQEYRNLEQIMDRVMQTTRSALELF